MSDSPKYTESFRNYLNEHNSYRLLIDRYFLEGGRAAELLEFIRNDAQTEKERDEVFQLMTEEIERDFNDKKVDSGPVIISIIRELYGLCTIEERKSLMENQSTRYNNKPSFIRPYAMERLSPRYSSGYSRGFFDDFFNGLVKHPSTSTEKLQVLANHPSEDIRIECANRLPIEYTSMFLMDKSERIRKTAEFKVNKENKTNFIVRVKENAVIISVLGHGETRRVVKGYGTEFEGPNLYDFVVTNTDYIVKGIRHQGERKTTGPMSRTVPDLFYLIESLKNGDVWIRNNIFKTVEKPRPIKKMTKVPNKVSLNVSFAKFFEIKNKGK